MRPAIVLVFVLTTVLAAPAALADDAGPQAVAWEEVAPSVRLTRTPEVRGDLSVAAKQAVPAPFYEVDPALQDSTARFSCATCMQAAPKKKWSGMAALYVWASSISGDMYVDGVKANIDADFSDLFDQLKYAFMGYFEVRHKKWSVGLDISTLKLEKEGPQGNLTADLTQTIVDVNVGYALIDCVKGHDKWGTCCYPRSMTLDVLVGARYWDIDASARTTAVGAAPITRSKTYSWIDPYIGARWRYQFAKRWGVSAYADYGGFGIGDGSESTWKLQAILSYRISRSFFVALGYRVIDVDRVDGPTATQTGVDAAYHGPILGGGFLF